MQKLETERVKIVVNGDDRQVPPGQNLSSLLVFLGIEADRVAVELDRAIVRKAEWDTTMVGEGARIEIVQFVGGG